MELIPRKYFVRALTEEFNLYEEHLALGTLKGKTRGTNVFIDFEGKFREKDINFTNIISLCKNGAPSLIRKNKGFVAHLKQGVVNHNALISFHCILHQQNLHAKPINIILTL